MAVQEGKVPGKSFSKERQSCLEMCIVTPRAEGDSPAGGLRSSAFARLGDLVGQSVDPNWQKPGFQQIRVSPLSFQGMPEIYLFYEHMWKAFFSPSPSPMGFVTEEKAQASETLQCFVTGTMGCKHIAGKMQSFKQ